MILKALSFPLACLVAMSTSAVAEAWLYGEEENPFTGKKDAWASILASSPTIGGSVLEPQMRLFVACIEGDFDVSLNTGAYIGNDWYPVRYRFDEGEPIVEKWAASADGLAVFVPRKFKDFQAGLATASKVAIEVADFQGVTYRTIFEDIENNRGVIERVAAACEQD
jgi:hypothetical protein